MRKLITLTVFVFLAFPSLAQDRVIEDDSWCEKDGNWNKRTERYCEVREYTLSANRDLIDVDGGLNGGITIKGWDKNEILVRAKVVGNARSEEKAEELAGKVKIMTGRTIEADVPRKNANWGKNTWVSVSFQVFVPYESNLELDTNNGGVEITDISGDVSFDVLNGGVTLSNMAGHVKGQTTNGGVYVSLTGDEWEGEGLNVKTTNGGVELAIPEGYSARLETGTVNGRLDFDFPVTVKGRLDRKISTTLGDGGKTIRVVTTNGAVSVKRS